ncbi:hypothetical protein H2198_007040 [Neophaeococcomyces mojaviensis]|uniref:Uncharacterized protein n=1 Tax=Neophaeococcomyces mojaviensis TaxID=3383035 RepID=A0ACC3A163_9EURO|nr:hypothetical protein H2198_007040 [Knufia sp. JES_112]
MSGTHFDRPHAQVSRASYRSEYFRHTNSPSMIPVSRKRPRLNSTHRFTDNGAAHTSYQDLTTSVSSLDCSSPAPLASTDYIFAGGRDPSSAWRDEHAELHDAEQDYRCNRFASHSGDKSFPSLTHRSQQHIDTLQHSRSLSGWHLRRAAWAMTGGLAGKIFNFCWNTTFRGFSAGGGQAYTSGPSLASTPHGLSDNSDSLLRKRHNRGIPGSYPRSSQSIDANDITSVSRSRQSIDNSATKNSWVFVERVERSLEDHSPTRKKSRASIAGPGRQNTFQPIEVHKNHTASFASPRPRATSGVSVHSRTHSSGSTVPLNKRQRTSLASPARRQTSYADLHQAPQSPISPEVEAYKRQKRREDRKQDDSLKRLNAQLQDMIREGQQALGSKVEVIDGHDHDYDMDEGYFDDEMR